MQKMFNLKNSLVKSFIELLFTFLSINQNLAAIGFQTRAILLKKVKEF